MHHHEGALPRATVFRTRADLARLRASVSNARRGPPTVHEATVSFLDQPGDHDSTEDLHPSALDPVQADLHAALARASLERTNAERDARDA
jgi:hypothetical protein